VSPWVFDPTNLPAGYSITDDVLLTNVSSDNDARVFGVVAEPLPATGQHYWELHLDGDVDNSYIGLVDGDHITDATSSATGSGVFENGMGWWENGGMIIDGSNSGVSGIDYSNSGAQVLQFAWDADTNTLEVGLNGTFSSSTFTRAFPAGAHIAVNVRQITGEATLVAEAAGFAHTPPTGYTELPVSAGGSTPAATALDDLTDVDLTDGAEGDVLTQQADGSYAPEPVVGVVPAGGASGQFLAKTDGGDYNVEWVDPPAGGGAAPTDNFTFDTDGLPTGYTADSSTQITNTGVTDNVWLFGFVTEALPATGQWYWEIDLAGNTDNMYVGLVDGDATADGANTGTDTGLFNSGMGWWENGGVNIDGSTQSVANGIDFSGNGGDVLQFTWDADTNTMQVGVNGSFSSSTFIRAFPTGAHIAVGLRKQTASATLVTAAGSLTHTPPSGFSPLGDAEVTTGISAISDLSDVDDTGASTGDVLTRQVDGTYAFDPPSSGALGALSNVSLPTTDDDDIGRALGLTSRSPDTYGLLPLMTAVPVSGGVDILAENDFATNNGTSLVASDTHLYDEVYIVGYELSTADVDLFFRPDGTNPAVWDIERLRMNAGGAVTVDLDTATDRFWFGDSGSNHSFRSVIKGTKAGIPLSLDRVFGTRSNAGFNHAVGIAKTTEECRALAVTFQSTVTTGRVYIVGVRQSSQPVTAPFDYTGTPAGVETLGRFVLPMDAKIRSGPQGQFRNGSNNSSASSVNIRVAGGATIGTISLPDTGDPVVSITTDVDLTAGDVLEIVTTQAETFTDLYGTLLLEGRG
jgi:hypothetical protein